MARLPVPGNDEGTWGTLLNEFLRVAHREDGTLRGVIDVANVRDFGATGDGVTDDTTAIRDAILDRLASGGIVYFPTGDYRVTFDFFPDEPISSNILLLFQPGARLAPDAGVTVRVHSPENIVASPRQQIHTGEGTLAFHAGGTVYVPWWNADAGDAAKECSKAFQSAIDSLPSRDVATDYLCTEYSEQANGGTVFVPSGIYLVTESIRIDQGGIVLVGASNHGSVICYTGEGAALRLGFFPFSIPLVYQSELERGDLSEDFRRAFEDHRITLSDEIDIRTNVAGSEWRIGDGCQGYLVRREDEALEIYPTPVPRNITVRRLKFTSDNTDRPEGSYAIDIRLMKYFIVEDCWFQGRDYAAIYVEDALNGRISDVRIDALDNSPIQSDGCYEHGIQLERSSYSAPNQITIDQCYIEWTKFAAIRLEGAEKTVIRNCLIQANLGHGVYYGACRSLTIHDCYFELNGKSMAADLADIYDMGGRQSEQVSISNNHFSSWAPSERYWMVHLTKTTGCVIKENHFGSMAPPCFYVGDDYYNAINIHDNISRYDPTLEVHASGSQMRFRNNRLLRDELLFGVGLEFQVDLDGGVLSPAFRLEFESHGVSLSGSVPQQLR